MSGPLTWQQPIFEGPGNAPEPIVINGQPLEATVRSYSDDLSEQGVVVETSGGQHVPHSRIANPGDPIALGRWEGELELALVDEDLFGWLHVATGLASVGQLSLWIDRTAVDVWIGTGSKTLFGLSRTTGYGSTGISWALRPARCFVGSTEQVMVVSAPAPGQCRLSQTTDSTLIELGAAPAAGVIVQLRYYPIRLSSAGLSMEISDANEGTATLSFAEYLPQRSYP